MSGYQLDPKFDAAKVLYIDSRDITSFLELNPNPRKAGEYLNTNFIYPLTEKVDVKSNQKCLVSLYNATIPHSFFNVRAGVNDTIPVIFYYVCKDAAGAFVNDFVYEEIFYLRIQDGNYNTDRLIEALLFGNDKDGAGGGATDKDIGTPFGYQSGDLNRPAVYKKESVGGVDVYPFVGLNRLKFGQSALQTDGGRIGGIGAPCFLDDEFISNHIDFGLEYDQNSNKFIFNLKPKSGGSSKWGVDLLYFQIEFPFFRDDKHGSSPDTGVGSEDNMANALYGFSGKKDYPSGFTNNGNDFIELTQTYPYATFYTDYGKYFRFCIYKEDGSNNLADAFGGLTISNVPQEYCSMASEQCLDLNDKIHSLFLRTNLVGNAHLNSKQSVFSNILATIPITTIKEGRNEVSDNRTSGFAQQGGIIYYNPAQSTHQSLVDLNAIDALGIKLTDSKGNTLDLNGLDFQIAILIQYVEAKTQQNPSKTRAKIDNDNQPPPNPTNPPAATPRRARR